MKAKAHKGELRQFKSRTVYHNEPPIMSGGTALHHSPRQPPPSPSCSQTSIRKSIGRPPQCAVPVLGSLAPGPAHGAVLARGARPGCAADPGERTETPPGPPAAGRLARSAIRQDKVKNKQTAALAAAAAIALRKIIEAL